MPDALLPVTHALAASEAIRQINHQTITSDGGLDMPSDLYATVSALAEMVGRLPQALDQLARLVETTAERPDLYDDRAAGRDARLTALAAGALVGGPETVELARQLHDALSGAANRLSHLGVRE